MATGTDIMQGLVSSLPMLLVAYWALAAGAATIALLPVGWAKPFRGKLWETRPKGALGPLSDASVPHKWFAHFYALGAAWNVTLLALCPAILAANTAGTETMVVTLLALVLLQVHLTRRLYESAIVARYPEGAKMHLVAYIFGLSYYAVLPLSLLPSAALAQALTAKPHIDLAQLRHLADHLAEHLTWIRLAGIVTFLVGNSLQSSSHHILAELNAPATAPRAGNKDTYAVPHGGLFELVSCPHYLAEIIIYAGLLMLASGHQPLTWLIFGWVVSNILLAALPTHQFYKKKFENYPASRRAIFPFIL